MPTVIGLAGALRPAKAVNPRHDDVLRARMSKSATAISLALALLASLPAHAGESSTVTASASTAAVALKGILVATRDITRPISAADSEAAPKIDALCVPAPEADKPPVPAALTDAKAVAEYRATLKQAGPIAFEPGSSITAQDEFRASLAPMLGQSITPELLSKLTQHTVAYVNAHSSGLNDVYFPQQNAADGVLVLVVSPARVGRVIAKGQQYVEGRDLACRIRQRHGEPVNTNVIADDLAYLNRNPWRRTDVAFAPGKAPGETDIVLNTIDQRPVRAFVGMDNAGSRLTGLGRYRAGVNWGNPFGFFDHRIDFSYAQAESAERFAQATLSYSMPLENRDNLSAYVSWARTHVKLEDGLFDSRGNNFMAGFEWARPLGIDTLSRTGNYPELYAGLEYKRIGSSLVFGEIPISNSVPEIFQGYLGYRGGWSDAWGHNDFDGRVTLSPGNLFGWNNDSVFEASRPGASSRYAKLNLTYDRYVPLPKGWQIHAGLNGQYTNQPLLSSEQFGVSGSSRVRGFYEDTLIADRALVTNLELQTPYATVPLGGTSGLLQGFLFLDAGRAWQKTQMTNADLERTGTVFNLMSYGFGARFNVNPYLTARAALGWRTAGLTGKSGMLGHFSITLAY